MTAAIKYCKHCNEEINSKHDICDICMKILAQKEKKDCVFCNKRVEVIKVEDFPDYELQFYSCGHKSRLFQRSTAEQAIKISDTVSSMVTFISSAESPAESRAYLLRV